MRIRAKEALGRALPKNAFARSVSVLVGGTAASQLLILTVSPVLTRLYTPEDFGLLAVYAGLLAILLVVASFRYELAIPLPELDQEAADIVFLSGLLVCFSALLSAVLVLSFSGHLATIFGVPRLEKYLWLIPLGILIGGLYNVVNYWAIRAKQFPALAATKLRQALVTVVIQLSAFQLGGVALIVGHVAGQGAGAASLAKRALPNLFITPAPWSRLIAVASRYRRFPFFSSWAGLLNTAGTQMLPLVLAAFFSSASAGLFMVAHRVTAFPLGLIGSAVGSVYFSGAAELHRRGSLGQNMQSLQWRLAHIITLPLLLVFIFGPEIFSTVFGSHWSDAGLLARWLTPWLLLQFCTSPITLTFAVLEKQHLTLLLQVVLFLTRTVAVVVGVFLGDLLLTIILYSFASALSYLLFLIFIMVELRVSFGRVLLGYAHAGGLALMACLPLLLVNVDEMWTLRNFGLMSFAGALGLVYIYHTSLGKERLIFLDILDRFR